MRTGRDIGELELPPVPPVIELSGTRLDDISFVADGSGWDRLVLIVTQDAAPTKRDRGTVTAPPKPIRRWLIRGTLVALVVGSILGLLRFGCGWWAPTLVDRLPDSATQVHLHEPDLFPDWGYWLQARVPQEDCEAFLDEVYPELRIDFDFDAVPEEHRGWAQWSHPDVPWWTQPPMEGTRVWWSGRDPWSFARCGDGMLHVQESTH